jgi:hypothetical protein
VAKKSFLLIENLKQNLKIRRVRQNKKTRVTDLLENFEKRRDNNKIKFKEREVMQ